MKKTCSWIMGGVGAPRCGKETKYRMADDGGEPGAAKVREYDHLCPEHRATSDAIRGEGRGR